MYLEALGTRAQAETAARWARAMSAAVGRAATAAATARASAAARRPAPACRLRRGAGPAPERPIVWEFGFRLVHLGSSWALPAWDGRNACHFKIFSSRRREARERELLSAYGQLGDANEVLNERAVAVMKRMSDKLTGRDFLQARDWHPQPAYWSRAYTGILACRLTVRTSCRRPVVLRAQGLPGHCTCLLAHHWCPAKQYHEAV